MENHKSKGRAAIVFLPLMLVLMLCLSPAPAFAGQTQFCDVTFSIIDETGKYDSAVVVGFINAETNQQDVTPVALEYANSYGAGFTLTVSVPMGRTYNLRYNFPPLESAKGLVVLSQDGSPAPTSITTDTGAILISIKIASEDSAPPAPAESTDGAFDPVRIAETNAEGNAVFTEFIEAMAPTVNNPAWDGFYRMYEDSASVMAAKDYEKYTGSPAQEYLDMSKYERFVIMETYIDLYACATAGMNDFFFGSEEKFLANAADLVRISMGNMGDTKAQQDAFDKVMLWEYAYIKENGLPYNYITGAADPSAIGGIERDSGIEVQLPNVRDEDLSDAELGLFDDVKPKDTSTMGMIKSSMSAIVVAAAAVVALLVFLAWKRKKNINEREDA